jgi:hypothetical protein
MPSLPPAEAILQTDPMPGQDPDPSF